MSSFGNLVSIVSPVYNGESYISRFLSSIEAQTYKPIELILVNDGSIDGTEGVVNSWHDRLAAAGISMIVLNQSNQGQACAIANGLQLAKGDFLIWPDTDDFLFPASIEERVRFLELNSQFGMVVSDGLQYDESDLEHFVDTVTPHIGAKGDVREYALAGRIYQSPSIMVRMDCFLKVNPRRLLHPTRNGQNVQLLLPLALSTRCGHLREPLYGRVLRSGSHSNSFGLDPKTKEIRTQALFQTVIQTLLLVQNARPWHYLFASLAYCGNCWTQAAVCSKAREDRSWPIFWKIVKKTTCVVQCILKYHFRSVIRCAKQIFMNVSHR